MIGYSHPLYACSLSEFGQPLQLPASGGWILQRPVRYTSYHDGMSCYPILTCNDWTHLREDLESLAPKLLTLAVVLDPFAPLAPEDLHGMFQIVKPFKKHFIVDLSQHPTKDINKHHRYYAQKALKTLRVEMATDPSAHLEEWIGLYSNLIQRHALAGIKAFSSQSFAIQFQVPGLVMFRALQGDQVVGAHLWFLDSGVAYSHLAAFTNEGYEVGAAYALYWEAIRIFGEQLDGKVRTMDLGAGAGTSDDANDGLTRFKRGWTPAVRTKYFCGRIYDLARYEEVNRLANVTTPDYFPAYRAGEF
ncbi:MAG: hypothetical protein JWO95_2861 [Verrucomicrobiales bacterium]|nr:hypothetical protein [Verrucomicrobiales bacterium]